MAKNESPAEEYLAELYDIYAAVQDSYDKTIITLASGSLAVSIAFIKDVLGCRTIELPWLLKIAWIVWGISFTLVLISLMTSQKAIRNAIGKVNLALAGKTNIHANQPIGGAAEGWTLGLNLTGGILYMVGLAFFLAFVVINWK
jgi:hypothetical protein